ncbi:MAG: hypothetical protein NTX88_01225 [Candidatus Atribacteria bacterium]|nr:hypothetical protein [Candidatus Atribacteria bacterium]
MMKRHRTKKDILPTWVRDVDLGQRQTWDVTWVVVALFCGWFLLILFFGYMYYPSPHHDFYVFERVESVLHQ